MPIVFASLTIIFRHSSQQSFLSHSLQHGIQLSGAKCFFRVCERITDLCCAASSWFRAKMFPLCCNFFQNRALLSWCLRRRYFRECLVDVREQTDQPVINEVFYISLLCSKAVSDCFQLLRMVFSVNTNWIWSDSLVAHWFWGAEVGAIVGGSFPSFIWCILQFDSQHKENLLTGGTELISSNIDT